MGSKIKLAISTCPNDTFAFHAILNNKIPLDGLEFDIELMDIQQLNDGLFAGRFDFAKASFHAAAKLTDETIVLPSGSALGFGVGPLLLAANDDCLPNDSSLTLCPGKHTTAAMLFHLFYGQNGSPVEHRLFSEIMPALKSKAADFGVCIHEGRFTWSDQGLALVEDLGTRWETETAAPLPLGGILARRSVDSEIIECVQRVIRRSIEYGLENRSEALSTMKAYAQEFDDEVLFGHVDLYVNDWTLDLGEVGAKALAKLSSMGKRAGLIRAEANDIEVWAGE